MRSPALVGAAAAVCVLSAAALHATPTIQIASPVASAGPIYDAQPTIAVAYSSADPAAPLDLGSLKILVNGADWTGKFSKGPGSASYTLSAQDALIAGKAATCSNRCALNIQASIADNAGAVAAAAQAYDIGPTFQAAAPVAASYGSTLLVSALGLDPEATRNAVVFSSNAFLAPFTTVDAAAGTGTLTVASGAVTGNVSVSVNGVASRESYPFTLLTDFPSCVNPGPDSAINLQDIRSMADGSLFAWYWGGMHPVAPCPPSKLNLFRFFKNPDESFRVVDMSVAQANPMEYVSAIAVDKSGSKPAVITSTYMSDRSSYVFRIHYHENLPAEDHVTTVPDPTRGALWSIQAVDFDAAGNLYLAVYGVFYKLSKAQLDSAEATLERVPAPVRHPTQFVIDCAGSAFFKGDGRKTIVQYDLKSAQVTNVVPVGIGNWIEGMTSDCHRNEIVGYSWGYRGPQFWKLVVGGSVTPLEILSNVFTYGPMAVAPDGTTYFVIDDYNWDTAASNVIGVVHMNEKVTPCEASGCDASAPTQQACTAATTTLSAQPYCLLATPPGRIEILTSTTRWKPQKDTATPIVVNFTAPKGYTPTASDITQDSTGSLLANQTIAITGPADGNADPGQYAITWSGPWSWTDSTTKLLMYQPAGNYTFKIRGTKADGTPLDSDPTQPCSGAASGTPTCSVVSLVEVTAIEMMAKPQTRGLVSNSTLGGPGRGLAIFPEARNPSPNDQVGDEDKVEITATVIPAVPDPRTQGPVTVYFRGLDVDDPSASGAPIDDETRSNDNCPLATPAAPTGCLVPPAGNVNGQNADAPVSMPLPSGQTQVTAGFQVSDRQGDNYRVAASTSSTWLGTNANGLSAKQNSTFGEVIHSSGESVLDADGAKGPQITEMLTVWRTLHLEMDYLDSSVVAQTQAEAGPNTTVVLDMTRNSTKIEPQKLTDDNASFVVKAPKGFKGVWDHARDNDWMGADLWPSWAGNPGGSVKVTGNSKTSVTTDSTRDLTKMASGGDPYRLSDDRAINLTGNLPLEMTRTTLRLGYISAEVMDANLNRKTKLRFYRNLEDKDQIHLPRNVPSSQAYWSLQVVDGFDGPASVDNDPDTEHERLAQTTLSGKTGVGADTHQIVVAVFRETVRDALEEEGGWKIEQVGRSLAHEVVCHAFDIGHEDGTICYAGAPSDALDLSAEEVAIIRRLAQPTFYAGEITIHSSK